MAESISDKIKSAMRTAAELHESSWDHKSHIYQVSLEGAAITACQQFGLPVDLGKLLELSLSAHWDESLEWAGEMAERFA